MRFTIIIPVYKVEKYLHKCMDSIFQQKYADYEVILVDDGSPDFSPKICDDYAKNDNRIVVIHKENGGVVSARNAGLAVAQGQYVLFIDADDWLATDALEILDKAICQNNEPDMLLFDAYRVMREKTELMMQSLEPGYYDEKRINDEIVPYMMYDVNQIFLTAMIMGQLWNKVIKRELIKEHHCSENTLYKSEDFACVYECIYFSKSFYYLKQPLYFYNKLNESSAMTVYDATYFQNHSKVIQYISEHLGKYSEVIRKQINAYNVSGICIGVFHEMRHKRGLLEARKHIKKQLEENGSLEGVNCAGLPGHAKLYMFLLKKKLYLVALLSAKVYLWIKK